MKTIGQSATISDVLIFLILAVMIGLFVYQSQIGKFLRKQDIPIDRINAMLPAHLREKSKHKRKIKHVEHKAAPTRKTVRRRKHSIGRKLKKTYELNEEQAQEKHNFSDPQKPRVSVEAKIQEQGKIKSKKNKVKKEQVKTRRNTKRQQKIDKIKTEMEKPIEKKLKKIRKTQTTKSKIKKLKQKRTIKRKQTKTKPATTKKYIEKRIKIEKPAPVMVAPPEPKRERPKLSPEEIRRQKKINKLKLRLSGNKPITTDTTTKPEVSAEKTQPKPSTESQPIQPNSLSSFYRLKRIYDKQKEKEEDEKKEIKKALSK